MSLLKIHTINSKLINWRKNKIDIVFTNGCFDLLHKGHINLLNKASKYGDILIVGLNSDSSVKKLKGEQRPIENERIRSKNLLNLECVNYVIVFNSQTPQDLVRIIMPDVLVKGADYSVNNIVGAEEVLSNGGRVEIVPLVDGYSTSSIIKTQNR